MPEQKIDRIRKLEKEGILAPESCPEPYYWWWVVLKPEALPEEFVSIYKEFGEIRWYGEE